MLWIGLFESEVTERCQHFSDATYAAVNAVAMAACEEEFVSRVSTALEQIGLRCVEYENVEPYDERVASHEVARTIQEAAERARSDGEVAFGTFHTSDEKSDATAP